MTSPNFQLTPLSKLFSNLKAELKALSAETRVSVDSCANRILSKDIFAKCDNPPFDNSAIDGFAVNEESGTTNKVGSRYFSKEVMPPPVSLPINMFWVIDAL